MAWRTRAVGGERRDVRDEVAGDVGEEGMRKGALGAVTGNGGEEVGRKRVPSMTVRTLQMSGVGRRCQGR